jgi:predicted Zn finger-like uncharacterized protein
VTEAELQPLVTRCPDCSTQFKVSEAQLQVANGKVRCGSCLEVFEGVDNLVWDADFDADESADVTLDDLLDELKEEGSTPESELGAAKANSIAELDWVADVETQSAPELEPETDPELGPESEQGSSSQDNAERSSKVVETDTDSVDDPQVDDSDDEFDRELAANQIVQAANDSTEPHIDFRVELIEVPAEDELLDLGSSYIGPDYASLKRTPDQQEEQQRRSRNRRDAMAEMHALSVQREADEAATPIDEMQIADTPASVPAVSEADLQAASATAYPPVEELEQVWERKPDPQTQPAAEVAETPKVSATGAAAVVRNWRIPLVVGALVLLATQVMYLQFDDWAIDPSFRPAYAAVCAVLPCDLPDRRDLDLLKSRALKVRSHPQEEGALLVDALIINEAEFDQPFPVLHLKFASVEGNPLRSERFSPADYLAGDMTGVKMMPARTPVHIEVQAIDPGPGAVSYTLDFE